MAARRRRHRPSGDEQHKEVARPARRRPPAITWVAVAAVLVVGAWFLHRALLAPSALERPAAVRQLNVLLITVDTTRADYLGCYGRPAARTPNIDRLASAGTRFAQCRSCSALTLPSHASILTAVYPYVHGARRNGTGRLAGGNLTLAEALRDAGYRTQAAVASFVLNSKFGTNQGFEVYHDVIVSEMDDALHAERKGDEACDDALGLLRSLAGQRFFLWVHFYDPHYPYESRNHADTLSPLAYADEIAFMDVQIGRLLDELRQLDLERDTLVVLVGDHGEGLGQHGELLHGVFLYDTTVHVPLIFHCPGTVPAGQTVAAQVRTIDVAPTILDLVGGPALSPAQGVSLAPLLYKETQDLDLAAYAESLEARDLLRLSLLRTWTLGEWKYVLAPQPELYHLPGDPGEAQNRAEPQADRAAEMRAQLRELIAAAPPPYGSAETSVALQADEVARLQSLGYTGSASSGQDDSVAELDRFEPQGGDPKDHAELFEWKARAAAALLDQEYGKAERLLRQIIAVVPAVPSVHIDLARSLHKQGRLAEAEEVFRHAIALAPDDHRGRAAYGNFLLFAVRRYEEAVEQLVAALEQMPDDMGALHDMGAALLALQRAPEAERYLQRALTLEPRTPRVLQALGVLRLKQNRLEEAADYFRRTLELAPDTPEARAALQFIQQRSQP